MTTIRISGICEKDIDLLLLEEFIASPSFLVWFLQRVQLPEDARLSDAARSVSTATGESDLELTLESPSGVVKVLIENKVGALLQPQQAERYRKRSEDYKRNEKCSLAITTIVAPTAYFGQSKTTLGFDHRVTYESILEWFLAHPSIGMRGEYKCHVLRTAIERGQSGWQMIPDAAATAFWRSYWELATVLAPELQMPMPEERPCSAAFIDFKPASLSKGVRLRHGLPYGNVQLLFEGKREQIEKLHQLFGHNLTPQMRLEPAGKSAAIRMSVPVVDQSAPFSMAESAVRDALTAASELLAWYKHNVVRTQSAT